jgi:hypothetical protein
VTVVSQASSRGRMARRRVMKGAEPRVANALVDLIVALTVRVSVRCQARRFGGLEPIGSNSAR